MIYLLTIVIAILVIDLIYAGRREINRRLVIGTCYPTLIRCVLVKRGRDRALACSIDLLNGIAANDVGHRAEAWRQSLSWEDGYSVDAERDGLWVPAVSENIKTVDYQPAKGR